MKHTRHPLALSHTLPPSLTLPTLQSLGGAETLTPSKTRSFSSRASLLLFGRQGLLADRGLCNSSTPKLEASQVNLRGLLEPHLIFITVS